MNNNASYQKSNTSLTFSRNRTIEANKVEAACSSTVVDGRIAMNPLSNVYPVAIMLAIRSKIE